MLASAALVLPVAVEDPAKPCVRRVPFSAAVSSAGVSLSAPKNRLGNIHFQRQLPNHVYVPTDHVEGKNLT